MSTPISAATIAVRPMSVYAFGLRFIGTRQ
jgi:hypothetical protein